MEQHSLEKNKVCFDAEQKSFFCKNGKKVQYDDAIFKKSCIFKKFKIETISEQKLFS